MNMKTISRKAFSLLLAACFMVSLLPALALETKAAAINGGSDALTFDGSSLSGSDAIATAKASGSDDADWGSTKTWYIVDGTLYLNNFEYTTTAATALTVSGGTIDLSGTNKLTSMYNNTSSNTATIGLLINGDTTLTGSGSLTATGGETAGGAPSVGTDIETGAELTVIGATLNASSKASASTGTGFGVRAKWNNIITLSDEGTINATANNAQKSSIGLSLFEGTVTLSSDSKIIAKAGDGGTAVGSDADLTGVLIKGSMTEGTADEQLQHDANDEAYKINGTKATYAEITAGGGIDYTLLYDPATGKFHQAQPNNLSNSLPQIETPDGITVNEDKSLTFDNFEFSTSAYIAMSFFGETPVKIHLADGSTNSVTSIYNGTETTYGMKWSSPMTITGNTGTLTITGGSSTKSSVGITPGPTLTVEGGNVTVIGGSAKYSYGSGMSERTISVTGGTLIAKGGTATDYSYGMNVQDNKGTISVSGSGTIIAIGDKRGINSNNSTAPAAKAVGSVSTDGSDLISATWEIARYQVSGEFGNEDAKYVKLTPPAIDYSLSLEEGELCKGINGDAYTDQASKWSYDSDTGVLTLKDFHFTTEAPVGLYLPANVTIHLESGTTNSITSIYEGDASARDSIGINALADLTFSGTGSLIGTGGEAVDSSVGIGAKGKLTVQSGTVTGKGGTAFGSVGVATADAIAVSGGTLNAEGGTSTNQYGIQADTALSVTGTGKITAKGDESAVSCYTGTPVGTAKGNVDGDTSPLSSATWYGAEAFTYKIGDAVAKYVEITPVGGGDDSGGGKTPGGGGGGGSTSTPKDNTTEVVDTTITTTGNQKVVENDDGSKSLPSGGTLDINNEVKLTAPNGTTIDPNGTVNIPDGKMATLDLVDADAKAAIPGGSTIDTNGTITVGGGKATITLPGKSEVTLPEGSTISGKKAVVGSGSASVKGSDGKSYSFNEGDVLIFDEDVPLGVYAQYQSPFVDVKEGAWYFDAVRYVFENGIMNGTSANTFEPGTLLNRGMMVQILYNIEGKPAAGAPTFDDVSGSDWYGAAVGWGAPTGVILGVGQNKFAPEWNVTREQMAAMLYRYCRYKSIELPEVRTDGAFSDSGSIENYAVEAVNALYKAGILNGKENNTFDPQGNATRAEVAQMLMNFMEVVK